MENPVVPRIEEKQVKMENNDTKNKLIFIFFTRLSWSTKLQPQLQYCDELLVILYPLRNGDIFCDSWLFQELLHYTRYKTWEILSVWRLFDVKFIYILTLNK